MSNSKKVVFRLAPVVHIYKKRLFRTGSPFDEYTTNVFSVDTPNSAPAPFHSHTQPPVVLPTELSPKDDGKMELSISIPKNSCYDEPTPISYDNSPFSPNTSRAIQEQRFTETELRKDALNEAFIDFCNSMTPHSQRTPASLVLSGRNTSCSPPNLSPLCLSPIPLSTANSSSNLSECD